MARLRTLRRVCGAPILPLPFARPLALALVLAVLVAAPVDLPEMGTSSSSFSSQGCMYAEAKSSKRSPSPPPRPPRSPPPSPPPPRRRSPPPSPSHPPPSPPSPPPPSPPSSPSPPPPLSGAFPPLPPSTPPPTDCQFAIGLSNRSLHTCAMGYAKGVRGGFGGEVFTVSDSSDGTAGAAPGTLRSALSQPGRYIVFQSSMDIYAAMNFVVQSNTTIDGRGVRVRIFLSSSSIQINTGSNIVIHNVEVYATTPAVQHLIYMATASNVWIDHCRFVNGSLGTTNAFFGSTNITLSNNFYTTPTLQSTLQLGHDDAYLADAALRVTFFRNVFVDCWKAMPIVRVGIAHMVQNVYRNWGSYVVLSRGGGIAISKSNMYVAGNTTRQVTAITGNGTVIGFGDLLLNSATFQNFSYAAIPTFPYTLPFRNPDNILLDFVSSNAGPQVPQAPPPPPPPVAYPTLPPSSPPGPECQYANSSARSDGIYRCVFGFAAYNLTGGAKRQKYVVTSALDDPAKVATGTLRWAVASSAGKGAYISFAGNLTIALRDVLRIQSDTTIDGRGFRVRIINASLLITTQSNIIIHNVQVSNIPRFEAIRIDGGSRIWLDHLFVSSASNSTALVTMQRVSTNVTISNCIFSTSPPTNIYPNSALVFGLNDGDTGDVAMRVTVFRNWFYGVNSAAPTCRYGGCHVVNNYYYTWGSSVIGAKLGAAVLSEANVYEAGATAKSVTANRMMADGPAYIKSSGDLFLNQSTFLEVNSAPALTLPYNLTLARVADYVLVKYTKTNSGPRF